MNTHFETTFTVMPAQTNYMHGPTGRPMIFGGAFMSEMDLCAASAVSRLLASSKTANQAVTYKCTDFVFHAAAECGDIIFLHGDIVELRTKAVVVHVKCWRERRASPDRDFIAEGKFIFLSKLNGVFTPHGLSLQ